MKVSTNIVFSSRCESGFAGGKGKGVMSHLPLQRLFEPTKSCFFKWGQMDGRKYVVLYAEATLGNKALIEKNP